MHRATARRIAAAAAILLLAPAGPALGHSDVAATSPAGDASLGRAPARVVVTYEEALGGVDAAGVVVAGRSVGGTPRVDPGDRRRLVIPLAERGPGRHAVTWTVIGADGHRLRGATAFTVRPPDPLAALRAVAARLAAAVRALEALVAR